MKKMVLESTTRDMRAAPWKPALSVGIKQDRLLGSASVSRSI
jgi:hypothetical protein